MIKTVVLNMPFIIGLLIFPVFLLVIFNSYNWQFIPISFYIIWFFLSKLPLINSKNNRISNKFWIFSFTSVLFGTLIILFLFPFVKLPEPTGSFKVGTNYLVLNDSSRINADTSSKTSVREIYSQIWYPANLSGNEDKDIYIPDAILFSRLLTKSQNISWLPFLLNHLGKVKTNSYLNAQVLDSDGRFPVIIFSHGLNQFYKFNTSIIEELVSNGYIVIGIVHPYDTPCAVNNNKLVVYKQKNIYDEQIKLEDSAKLDSVWMKIETSDNLSEQQELYRQFYDIMPVEWYERYSSWMKDILFVKKELSRINIQYFNKSMNLNSIGVIGFSFGGGAAGLAAMADTSIKAGINLDGWQPGHLNKKYFQCPFMFITSEEHKGANGFFQKYSEKEVLELTIPDTKHPNFNDMAFLLGKGFQYLGYVGRTDGRQGLSNIKKSVVRFFDVNLKGKMCIR
jgi:predicted dienelactone hydrolase